MKEITKIDMNKYLVIKNEDLKYLEDGNKLGLFGAIAAVNQGRRLDGKTENNYLVLNLDDEIDWDYLEEHLLLEDKIYVKDIAVALVNAILKARENK